MKRCALCRETKPTTEFYRVRAYWAAYCKPCYAEKSRGYSKAARERGSSTWSQRNPERVLRARKAREAVKKALYSGRLVRPDRCSACGLIGPAQAAHGDYAQPLVVTWLCQRCHRSWDRNFPKTVPGASFSSETVLAAIKRDGSHAAQDEAQPR